MNLLNLLCLNVWLGLELRVEFVFFNDWFNFILGGGGNLIFKGFESFLDFFIGLILKLGEYFF